MRFPYVNSISAQRWYRINVKDYSISAQRWYRIELKSFNCCLFRQRFACSSAWRDKRKWTEYLRLIKKEGHHVRKVLMDIDPRKRRMSNKRLFWEISLMYSLSSRIHFEFIQSCDKSYMFNLTNIGLSMCVMEYSDLFLNLI